eukprot:CAMPEP_0181375490 /NCGR_PEP_ID=MMETSP1106-20121128/16694_1 /TAXON_ID=81844 /ORGANISM="Mantoniella antarctica, Strain SL-175" /LENGTH=63 /DNA_ID=CAMNT_0023493767 /DNA_START=89 /DNA_END=278 /DNA_ORIENTATION=-
MACEFMFGAIHTAAISSAVHVLSPGAGILSIVPCGYTVFVTACEFIFGATRNAAVSSAAHVSS